MHSRPATRAPAHHLSAPAVLFIYPLASRPTGQTDRRPPLAARLRPVDRARRRRVSWRRSGAKRLPDARTPAKRAAGGSAAARCWQLERGSCPLALSPVGVKWKRARSARGGGAEARLVVVLFQLGAESWELGELAAHGPTWAKLVDLIALAFMNERRASSAALWNS